MCRTAMKMVCRNDRPHSPRRKTVCFDNRTTKSSAELVPTELGLRQATRIAGTAYRKTCRPGVGVELVVAEELIQVPVKIVRPRLDGGVDDPTLVVAEFG